MSKQKPILLFFENLVEPIKNTKAELDLIKNEIDSLNKEFLRKGVFAYTFALFETSLSDCLKRYLNEVPAKLPMQEFSMKNRKNDFVKATFAYKLLESLIDDYIRGISYGKTKDFLDKFCELLSIENVSSAFSDSLNEKKERRNLLLHNSLIINNSYIEKTGNSRNDRGHKLNISKEYLIETIKEIRELLSIIESRLFDKYSKYTKLKVIKDIWNYLFDSPILRFEDHWIIKNNEVVGYNSKTKKWANNFSGSERTLLALFLQNFSPEIVDSFSKFKNLSMFVSINGEKIAFIIEIFEKYPLLLQNNLKRNM